MIYWGNYNYIFSNKLQNISFKIILYEKQLGKRTSKRDSAYS